MNRCKAVILAALMPAIAWSISFTQSPALTPAGGGQFQVQFTVDESTDVEVAIVNLRDSSIVRHLAAGLLGANPPTPLQAGTLAQTIAWDGSDDFGRTVANPESLRVRVRAGMTPRLSHLAGEDLYTFNQGTLSLAADKDGSVYLLGKAGASLAMSRTFLRKYDASGNYLKTVFPPSADLPADSVTSYGINVIPGGGWAPRTIQTSADKTISPKITNALLNNDDAQLLALTDQGEFIVASGLQAQNISRSGAFSGTTRTLVSGPPQAPAATFSLPPFGPRYIALSQDPKYLYLSGWFYGTIDHYYFLETADTTGFWADGQVLKLDIETGIAVPWLKLDSVPVTAADRAAQLGSGLSAGNFASTHGVTVDDSGHVFVCDRLHRCVAIYDTSANLLGTIACVNPDLVAVSKRTGFVYVLRRGAGSMTLAKYEGWRNSPALAASTVLTTSVLMTGRYEPATPSIGLVESGNGTSVYVGYQTIGFRLYADNGSAFTLTKDFSADIKGSLTYERIAVDRRNDRVYWTHGPRDACPNFVIYDWNNPVVCSLFTPAHQPVFLDNITVAPNGFMYGRPAGYPGYPSFFVPVIRYTSDSLPVPANYANTGTNVASGGIWYEGGSIGLNHRGVAVGWQNQIAVYEEHARLLLYPDTGCADTGFKGTTLITVPNSNTNYRVVMNGVKFDPAGNYYVGVIKRDSNAITPAGFETDDKFVNFTGSVMKFAAGTTGIVNAVSYRSVSTVEGMAKVYPQPFGYFSGDNSSMCNCRNSYFDVDPYGRLFIPSAASSQVYIADNAGNTIVNFGEYGNTDARDGIPIAWSTSVAASEDYVVVADAINARIVRVRMDYAIDNFPGLTDHNSAAARAGAATRAAPTLTAAPNPFNPSVAFSINGPSTGMTFRIYNLSGQFVADLSGQLKAGNVVWNATGNSSGVYVAVAQKGNLRISKKIIYSK